MQEPSVNGFRVATSEMARDINRRVVLNLIRKHQPISRADLARQSGLQRSTVSVITDQLIDERWVTEGATGHLPRGRKPTYLHLNNERAGIIGVNIRPLRTTVGLATLDSHFVALESMVTGNDEQRFVDELVKQVVKLMETRPQMSFEGIGVAMPGRVDLASGRLVFAPNLPWKSLDVKQPLEKATGLTVELENAANACALAESWSARKANTLQNLVAVTVSEGIGIGMILNGRLVRGSSGLAGEFGHVTLQEDGPPCNCGSRGCWEVCGSNSAAVRYYHEAVSGRRSSKSTAAKLTFEDILRLAEQGDKIAGEALDRMAHFLGSGIAMLMSGLDPDVIVLIGEVTRAWDRIGPIIHGVVKERQSTHLKTRIVATDPNTEPRLRGTIALVLQKHFGTPFLMG